MKFLTEFDDSKDETPTDIPREEESRDPGKEVDEEEDFFDPNDDKPDEEEDFFDPNDDKPDEEEDFFDPNDDKPDEEEDFFDPNDDKPDEEEDFFDPNDDKPDEEEDFFDPNDDKPEDIDNIHPEKEYNLSNTGTITVVVPENPEEKLELENLQPEEEPEGIPGDKFIPIDSETGEPAYPPVDPELYALIDLIEEMNEALEGPEEILDSESDQEADIIPDQNPELETDQGSDQNPEEKLELENLQPEQEPGEISGEKLVPCDLETREPAYPPVDPYLYPLIDLIQEMNEALEGPEEILDTESDQELDTIPDQNSELETDQGSDQNPEQEIYESQEESEVILNNQPESELEEELRYKLNPEQADISEQESEQKLDQNPEQGSDQKPEYVIPQKQKYNPKKGKKLELITDPEILKNYKNYEYEINKIEKAALKAEKEENKDIARISLRRPSKEQKTIPEKKSKKGKKLELITDPEILKNYKNYEYEINKIEKAALKAEKEENKDIAGKSLRRPSKEQKTIPEKKSKKGKKLELITDPEILKNYKNYEYEINKIEKAASKAEKNETKNHSKKPIDESLKRENKKSEKLKKEVSIPDSKDSINNNPNQTPQVLKASSKSQNQPLKFNKKLLEKQVKETRKITINEKSKERQDLMDKYRRETGKRPLYSEKKTKGFLKWLKEQKKSLSKKETNNRKKLKEDWEVLLEKWIIEADEKDILPLIKKKLIEKIRKFRKLRDLRRNLINLLQKEMLGEKEKSDVENLIKEVRDLYPLREEIFENLKAFKNFYDKNIQWFQYKINAEKRDFPKHLAKKLMKMKAQSAKIEKITSTEQDWKQTLIKNLNLLKKLDNKEIQSLKQIVKKNQLTQQDLKKIVYVLSKLDTEILIQVLGEGFGHHTTKYVKLGYDLHNVKSKILLDFFQKMELRNISKRQILYVNKEKKLKECSICHRILPFNKFYPVSKNSLKVRPYCKKCSADLHLIIQYRTKLKLILNDFNGKCSKCSSDVLILPALQFHHLNPQKKKFSWRNLRGKSYYYISNLLKRENAILLCANCHLKEQATILKKYHKIILHENLFKFTPEEINNHILNETEKIIKKLDRMHIRAKIRSWIKKRFILKHLYGGKCIGCGNTNLYALTIHHLDPQIDNKSKWKDLENIDTKAILKKLIDQNCICLCSNCHSHLHSRYSEFAEKILVGFYKKDILQKNLTLIKNYHQNLIYSISNFKIKHQDFKIKRVLSLEVPHYDNWKIHMLRIYYYTKKLNNHLFKAYDLAGILKISIKHIYKHLNKFIEQNYVEKDPQLRGKFKFTDSGLDMIKKIKKNHKIISANIKKQILNL